MFVENGYPGSIFSKVVRMTNNRSARISLDPHTSHCNSWG